MKKITFDKTIYFFLAFVIVAYLFTLIGRQAHGDEAILAEQSYWLQKIGYVKSELYTGLGYNWEYVQYHYHKLFIVLGALVIKVIGVNVYALQTLVLVFTLLLARYFFKFQKVEIKQSNVFIAISFILLFTQYHFNVYSFLFRPEVPVVALGFLSFYQIYIFINEKLNKNLVLGALFAGISLLLHLNGLVYVAAGFTLLLINKQWSKSLYFVSISAIVSLLYFFNITSVEAFNTFLYQFTNDPNLHKADFSILLKFEKLISEHKRYFHSPREIVISVLFFFLFISNFKQIYSKNKILTQYTLLVLFFLAIIAHDKTVKYSILYIPFVLIIITTLLKNWKDFRMWYKVVLTFILVIYFLVNSFVIYQVIENGYNLKKQHEKYASYMPIKHSKVLTREQFFFNQIHNYTIVSTLSFEYNWMKEHKTKPDNAKLQDFYKFAKNNNIDYILLENKPFNKTVLNCINYKQLKLNDTAVGYHVTFKDNDIIVLKSTK